MKSHKSILSRVSPLLLCSNATILVLALSAVTSVNADDGSTTTAYVDSIHKWGAWELDIEPAAGGLQHASTQALNARDSRLTLRTNSIAALEPQRPATPTTPPAVPAIPATPTNPPAVPAIPAAPTIPAPPGATPPVVVTLP